MRAAVAIVESRPETVLDDYRRVLDLAGLAPDGGPCRLVADGGPAGGWFPGAISPPWQLAGTLADLPGPTEIYALDEAGRRLRTPEPSWRSVLAETGATLAPEESWDPRRAPAIARHDVLATALPDGVQVPAGLTTAPLLLLPVPRVGGGWPVAGAVALLMRLLAPRPRRLRRQPAARLPGEVVAYARSVLAVRGAVLDGANWSIRDGNWRRRALQGNLLIAGADPVAVDAVATRLVGADPLRVPWLRYCDEQEVGTADPRRIRLAGRADLAGIGLDLPPVLLAPAGGLPRRGRWPERWWHGLRRSAALRTHRHTPWGRLREDYCNGEVKT